MNSQAGGSKTAPHPQPGKRSRSGSLGDQELTSRSPRRAGAGSSKADVQQANKDGATLPGSQQGRDQQPANVEAPESAAQPEGRPGPASHRPEPASSLQGDPMQAEQAVAQLLSTLPAQSGRDPQLTQPAPTEPAPQPGQPAGTQDGQPPEQPPPQQARHGSAGSNGEAAGGHPGQPAHEAPTTSTAGMHRPDKRARTSLAGATGTGQGLPPRAPRKTKEPETMDQFKNHCRTKQAVVQKLLASCSTAGDKTEAAKGLKKLQATTTFLKNKLQSVQETES